MIKRFFGFLLIVLAVFCLTAVKSNAETNINPISDLYSWTYEQNVGITAMKDFSENDWSLGAKWQLFKSEHDWLYSGLIASGEKDASFSDKRIGVYVSGNIGKIIEKIKSEPLVYLEHLEVGVYSVWSVNDGENYYGVFINVIRIEF